MECAVHITVPTLSHGSESGTTIRHRNVLAANERIALAGFVLTSAERTVFDLARSEPFPIALACADAYVKSAFRVRRRVDQAALQAWRDRMVDRADHMPRGRGMGAVRAIAAIADPLADSPLESVSRLRLLQLGLVPELQVGVPSERGGTYYLDFLFRELGVFGECDGKSKYTNPELRGGNTADEIVYAEKRRHDWIAGSQGLRGVRWGAPDTITAALLGRHLSAQGIRVPGRPTRRYGAQVARFLGGVQ